MAGKGNENSRVREKKWECGVHRVHANAGVAAHRAGICGDSKPGSGSGREASPCGKGTGEKDGGSRGQGLQGRAPSPPSLHSQHLPLHSFKGNTRATPPPLHLAHADLRGVSCGFLVFQLPSQDALCTFPSREEGGRAAPTRPTLTLPRRKLQAKCGRPPRQGQRGGPRGARQEGENVPHFCTAEPTLF